MFSKKIINDIQPVAEIFGLDLSYFFAICLVETRGKIFVRIQDREEPIIRFEGHYFDRRLKGNNRVTAREQNLSSPFPGKILNPRRQEERWQLLHRAASIHWNAAMESVSWGIGQVMGANWALLNFKNIKEFVAQARSGCDGQAALMANYIHKANLFKPLINQNWEQFAYGYNGPHFKKNNYHIKLQKAYEYFQSLQTTKNNILAKGLKSNSVLYLQWLLKNTGKKIQLDGIFGPKTEQALLQLQKEANLPTTGIAESKTLRYLRSYKKISHATFYVEKNIPPWLKYLHCNASTM